MKKTLGLIFLIYGFLFTLYSWFLIEPHEGFRLLDILLIGLFIGLVAINVYLHKVNRQKVLVASIIFFTSFLWGYLTSLPVSRTVEDTIRLNNAESTAVKKGISYADEVTTGKISEYDAEKRIENDVKLSPELKRVSKKAMKLALEKNISDEDIINESSNIVPVGQDNWDCNQNGCGYSDNSTVWTIGTVDRYVSFFIMLVSHLFLASLIFDKFYHQSLRHFLAKIPYEIVEIRK